MPNTPRLPFALRSLAALLICTGLASAAYAQWQWIDNSGRKVFSDTAPPAGTPDKNILKRPAGGATRSAAPAAPSATPTPTAPAAEAPAQPSAADKELEARKKAAEAAEAQKEKEKAEQQARARAENCQRARQAKTTLDSGVRVATTNAKGEREIMDDTRRASETQRLQEIIRSDCAPAAQ